MPTRKTVTVAELKSLFLMGLQRSVAIQMGYTKRIQQELGVEAQEENPENIAIKNKFLDWVCDIIAHRLKRKPLTTPLLSSADFKYFAPFMIDAVAQVKNLKLTTEDREILKKDLKSEFENFIEVLHGMMPPNMNLYEAFSLKFKILLDLAAERGVLPTELIMLEEVNDEITRRMFSKEQFITNFENAINKYLNVDVFKKNLLGPIIDLATEDELRMLEQIFMPKLRETVEKTKAVVNTLFAEEIVRTYVVA